MTSSPFTNSATDQIVDAVTSQAVEIAKDVAIPAAKVAAGHFFRSRAKGIAIVLVAASVVTAMVRKKKVNSSSDTDRPSFDGVQEVPVAKEKA